MEEQRRLYYLDKMGIQTWVTRTSRPQDIPSRSDAGSVTEQARPPTPLDAPAGTSPVAGLDELRNVVAACTLCALHRGRTQTVFGTGNPRADWLVVGEAPGFEEDRQGEPFVGRAGQLLTKMLRAINLAREEVFIANILKCRPPDNRDPQPQEIGHCLSYLRQQIELIQPKIILAMGRIAAQTLLDTHTSIGRLRGSEHYYADTRIPVVVTYHPAYLLRSPQQKRKAWEDLQLAVRVRESCE
ncbi:MAG: uracil-DNA glycosylase [Gammaproteobacteria bacterium]|nr:uracil-DNA glycosylase [Gammaproteobacteria bacterium]